MSERGKSSGVGGPVSRCIWTPVRRRSGCMSARRWRRSWRTSRRQGQHPASLSHHRNSVRTSDRVTTTRPSREQASTCCVEAGVAGAGDAPPARRALVRPMAHEFVCADCGSGRLLCLTPTGTAADADHSCHDHPAQNLLGSHRPHEESLLPRPRLSPTDDTSQILDRVPKACISFKINGLAIWNLIWHRGCIMRRRTRSHRTPPTMNSHRARCVIRT